MAFHQLPPHAEFLATRLTREFSARATFECHAGAAFLELLRRRGTSHEALLAVREKPSHRQAQEREGRDPSGAEIADVRVMLSAEGAAPVSDSAARFCGQQDGRKATGAWSFVASFRAEKKSRSPREARRSAAPQTAVAAPADQDAAAQTMIDMGFKEADVSRALQQTSFHFGRALLLLLNALGATRASELVLLHARAKQTVAQIAAWWMGSRPILLLHLRAGATAAAPWTLAQRTWSGARAKPPAARSRRPPPSHDVGSPIHAGSPNPPSAETHHVGSPNPSFRVAKPII